MQRLLYALSLLTALPVRLQQPPAPGDSGRAAGWYPAAGLLLGGAAAAGGWLFGQIFPPLITAVLTVMLWAALSGGLHLDGLADCCDGLLNTSTPQRRLEIMRDSRLGSFGAVGLVLVLFLKIAALVSLPAGMEGVLAILLAASAGRWLVLPAGAQPPARPDGMGADFSLGLQPQAFVWGAVLPLILAALSGIRGLAALPAALLAAAGVILLARRRIGGVTGDVFGAVVEVGELATLLVFSIRL
ncbi:MAG: adenosylcobinamide-GDP ribazoletransferase [Anaerolineaceae bacterium]|nr:adenosylcobinamide-GDP ribazoletransferase [Anaerolineaceae bacterium]